MALAQRRHFDPNHRQPVPEILAEFAFLNQFVEIAVRGRDHPHIDLFRSRRADRTNLALLQKSQEFQLKALVNLSDLIQEHRPVIGRFKHADAVPVRSCVGAANGSEELAFDQRGRDGSAIDRKEGLV